jgi:TRAP-type C4-dicarboxylate transport system permease small subunit
MAKKFYYNFILLFILLTYNICNAAILSPDSYTKMSGQENAFRGKSGFSMGVTVNFIVATIIQAFLGLLGIIFIVLIVMAGYKWMNAAGNEEKVTEAKDTIRRAIIGLIITVSAYAITYFVFTNLPGGGGTTVPG